MVLGVADVDVAALFHELFDDSEVGVGTGQVDRGDALLAVAFLGQTSCVVLFSQDRVREHVEVEVVPPVIIVCLLSLYYLDEPFTFPV